MNTNLTNPPTRRAKRNKIRRMRRLLEKNINDKDELKNPSSESLSRVQLEVDTVSTESPVGKSGSGKRKKRKLRVNIKDEMEIMDTTNSCLEISTNGNSCVIAETVTNLEINSIAQHQGNLEVDTVLTELCPVEQPMVDRVSTEMPEIKREMSKSMKKRLKRKRAKMKKELDNVDLTKTCLENSTNEKSCIVAKMDTNLDIDSTARSVPQEQTKLDNVDLAKKCLEISTNEENCLVAKMDTTLNITARTLSQEQTELDKVSTEIVTENSANMKKKKGKKNAKKKVQTADGFSSMDQGDTFLKDSCQLPNGKSCIVAEVDTNLAINSTAQSLSPEKSDLDKVSTEIALENSANGKKKKRKRKKHVNSNDSCLLPKISQFPRPRRILLILDVNGLLADIVTPPPKERRADINIYRRAIFKRPHYYDFLRFCFQNFDVGIWSSRTKRIIDRVVGYLLGGLERELLFCWDMFYTTQTTFRTLDNKHKPLVCKELRQLWDKCDPKLPWKKGDYDETNTLLIDDSPYKALLNPMGTAIFPNSYTFNDMNDNALGPGGDLRLYLQDLAKTNNVQKYVEQHPFGQRAITDEHTSWSFYSKVLQSLSQPSTEQLPPQPRQNRPRFIK